MPQFREQSSEASEITPSSCHLAGYGVAQVGQGELSGSEASGITPSSCHLAGHHVAEVGKKAGCPSRAARRSESWSSRHFDAGELLRLPQFVYGLRFEEPAELPRAREKGEGHTAGKPCRLRANLRRRDWRPLGEGAKALQSPAASCLLCLRRIRRLPYTEELFSARLPSAELWHLTSVAAGGPGPVVRPPELPIIALDPTGGRP